MAKYRLTGPDGATYEVTAPDTASEDEVMKTFHSSMKGASADFEKRKAADMAADRKKYAPTGSDFENAAAGAGKAIVDTGRGIAGLFGADNRAEIEESRRLDAPLMDTKAGLAGNVAGHIATAATPGVALKGAALGANALRATGAANALGAAGSAAIAPTTLKGAATLGGASGLVQPALDGSERAMNVGLGAAGSAAGQGAVNGLARLVRPNTSPAVQSLMAEGITPTPGQILGGGFKRAEEGLSSIPYVGDGIKRGQARAVEQLNDAAFNRALKPIGEKLPAGLQGREAVAHVESTLGAKYDALLPQMTAKKDAAFSAEVQNLRQMVKTGAIDPNARKAFERIINNDVLGKFQGQGAMTGQTLKQVESDLGTAIKRFAASQDADQRLVADALREVQSSLRDMVTRNNPAHAAELKSINEGWANFKRVQKAAAGLGADDGIFSAAQLQNAVKASDRSKDKGAFARGNALMQDLSDGAKKVLGPKLPDSGTPYRSLAALGLGGGAGMAAGVDPTYLGGAAAIPLLFSRPGQNALATLLARRPESADQAANALRRLAPYAALPAIGTSDR